MKFLVVLCVGLKDDSGDNLLDINQAPFSFLKRTDIKPTAEMLNAEIVRRHKLTHSGGPFVGPRPKHWGMETLRKWLRENPIEGESDVEFLRGAVE
jgi:hypothetical protein